MVSRRRSRNASTAWPAPTRAHDQRGQRDQRQEHRRLLDEARHARDRVGAVVHFPARRRETPSSSAARNCFRRRLARERDLVGVVDQAAFDDEARARQPFARQHHARTQREAADHAVGLADDARANLEIRVADADRHRPVLSPSRTSSASSTTAPHVAPQSSAAASGISGRSTICPTSG